MPTLILVTHIHASPEACFDLIRDKRVMAKTAGEIGGEAGLGQTVTFQNTSFGIRQRLRVRVVEFVRPSLFVDEMFEGKFRAFKHIHEFAPAGSGTLMRDTVIWTLPFGILGVIVNRLFLERHLRHLVITRNAKLKAIAETGL
jgi:ligand-binding SRPBCC domain-containing protein